MTRTSIICPNCKATLKLPSAVPAGLKPKCPRCGTLIVATTFARGPVSQSSVNPGQVLDDEPGNGSFNPLVAFGVALGGGVLVVSLIAALLFVCLGIGEEKKTPVTNEDDGRETVPVVAAKSLPKSKAAALRPLVELTPEDEKKVESATQRGVAFLKHQQSLDEGVDEGMMREGKFKVAIVGCTALTGLTLLECKVPANDPSVQGAAKYVRAHINQKFEGNTETYQVALAILFLCRLDDPTDRKLIRSLALRLVASQQAAGGWTYPSNPLNPQEQTEAQLLYRLQQYSKYTRSGDDPIYVGPGSSVNGPDMADNSNTQFALLALWAARRFELPLDPVLRLSAKRFRDTQMENGSWPYGPGLKSASPNPTMAAAGLLGLAIGYGIDSDPKAAVELAKDQVLQRAFANLANGISYPGNGGRPRPNQMYFLWSVERVAVLYHKSKIEGKDWYHWGFEILMAHQQPDGHWYMRDAGGISSDIVDTCFALLFLQRANLAKDLTDKIQELMAILNQPASTPRKD